MDQVDHLSDADLDRLLAGRTQGDARDAEALAMFFHEVRARYVTPPPAATRQAHLSQILAAAQLNAERTQASATASRFVPAALGAPAGSGSPAEAGAGSGPPPGAPGDGRRRKPRWRKRLVFGSIFGGSITAKVAIIGVVAATAATGGLAAKGFLPKSLQSAVAGAAGNVGVRLPNPHATAQIKADAQVQAGKVASTVERIVQQVAAAAEQPVKLTTSTVASTQTCTQNVSAIAAELLRSSSAGSPALAQSLAERATALAQESVGCALPAIGGPAASPSGGTKSPDGDTTERERDTAVAHAISGAVQGCAPPLKSAIETLVQAAITARSTAELQALAADARAVAAAAQGCAQGLGSALQTVLSKLPSVAATPKGANPAPAPTSGTGSSGSNGMSGLWNLMPGLPKGLPTAVPTPVPTAPKGTPTSNPAAWWTQFLSQLPTQPPKAGGGQPGTPGNASPGSGSWSGLTGSWNGSGSWSPYPSNPGGPGAQQQDQQPQQLPRHR